MSGTRTGGLKASAKNTERHGADYYKVIGSMGGKAKNPKKGFGADRERAREAGKKVARFQGVYEDHTGGDCTSSKEF